MTSNSRRELRQAVPTIASIAIGAVVWEIVGNVLAFKFFPPLTTVLARLIELTLEGVILSNLVISLGNLALGFSLAVVVGVAVGVLMGAFRKVEAALDVYVNALLAAPTLVFAPIFFTVWGIGNESIIAIVFMYAVFIIIATTSAAMKSVPKALIEMGRSYCASDSQLVTKIMIPAAVPLIMPGIRIGIARAVKGMINGEMFIAVVGLGAVITNAGRQFDAATILAVLIVIILVALAATSAVQAVDRRLTAWLPSTYR